MAEEAKKIRGTADLFRAGFEVFKINWKNFILMGAILFVAVFASTVIFVGINAYPAVLRGESLSSLPSFSPLSLIGLILLFLSSLVLGLAFNKLVYSAAEGKPETINDSVKYGFENAVPYFVVSLVIGIFVLLGIIALVIPGIIIAVWLSLASSIFVIEGKRGMAVLKRSKELVTGYFWPVLGRIVMLGLLIGIISALFNNVPFLSVALNLVTAPFATAYVYYVYKDLVAIKG